MTRIRLSIAAAALVLAAIAVIPTWAAEATRSPRPGALTAAELTARIDQAIAAKLATDKVPISPPADDAEFLRRVTLDLHGVVPKPDRVIEFHSSQDSNKRTALVDELLAGRQYGQHFGLIWFNRMVPRSARATSLVDDSLQPWLAEAFNAGRGWDAIVRDILVSEGDLNESPAANFFLAAAAGTDTPHPAPDRVAAAVSRLFLGLRLECCQCHNHPFNGLKQTDFWETAAFFVNLRGGVADRPTSRPKMVPVLREGEQVLGIKGLKFERPIVAAAEIEIPESNGKRVHARYLHGDQLDSSVQTVFRPAFAAWLASPSNRQFARAAVNRMWANFFGQGLVDPVDDMQPEHQASHPELLDLLTDEFIATGFDLKHLARAMVCSQAYGRTSTPPEGTAACPEKYGHMSARVMTADQLFDSLTQILQRSVGEHIANGGQKRKYGDGRERFRIYFQGGGDDDHTPVPAYAHGIPQVLRIMNSPTLSDGSKLIDLLTRYGAKRAAVVDRLYLTTLSRYPTEQERKRAEDFLDAESNSFKGYSDLLWVLLNSGEFLHNH